MCVRTLVTMRRASPSVCTRESECAENISDREMCESECAENISDHETRESECV